MKPWPTVRLGEVLTHHTEYIEAPEPREYRKLSVKLYGKGVVLDAPADGTMLKMKRHQLAKAGQVILSEIWGKKGAIGFVPPEGDGALCTSHFFLFDIREDKLDRRWLKAVFDANFLQEQLDAEAKGTTGYAAVRPKIFLACQIPLPPLAEQRRVVARIEELAAQIHEARTLRHQAAEEAEALVFSTILSELGSVSEACDKKLIPLEDACEIVTDGAHNTPRYVDEGVPLLTAKNVFWDRIDTANVRHISCEDHEPIYRRCPVKRGDVLFINIGATTGTARKVDFDLEFSVKNVAMLRANRQKLDTDFLVYLLRGPTVRDQIAERQAQTCQPFLALRDIRNLKVPVPPLAEQRRIVAELDALQAEVEALKRLQAETAAELAALLPSILNKAFKGEL
jgi:type I restriction enzyme S subunit